MKNQKGEGGFGVILLIFVLFTDFLIYNGGKANGYKDGMIEGAKTIAQMRAGVYQASVDENGGIALDRLTIKGEKLGEPFEYKPCYDAAQIKDGNKLILRARTEVSDKVDQTNSNCWLQLDIVQELTNYTYEGYPGFDEASAYIGY